jgi:hypothetical protein
MLAKERLSITARYSVKGQCFYISDNSRHSYGAAKTKSVNITQFAIMLVIIYKSAAAANENSLVTNWSKCGVR